MNSFYTKIVGVTQGNIQDYIKDKLYVGAVLRLQREPYNSYDSNAIAVYHNNMMIGHLSKEVAKNLAKILDTATGLADISVTQITGGGQYNYGVNVNIRITQTIKEDKNKYDDYTYKNSLSYEYKDVEYWDEDDYFYEYVWEHEHD